MSAPSTTSQSVKKRKPKKRWRRIIAVIHRDFGYFFTGATILYALSGFLVNHNDTWDPDFDISTIEVPVDLPQEQADVTDAHIRTIVESLPGHGEYRGYQFASDKRLKIFFADGSLVSLLGTGLGEYETIRRRELILRINKLHLHPRGWWRIFADAFAFGLVIISCTGLFILKGKKGLWGRGKWFVAAGLIIPMIAMYMVD